MKQNITTWAVLLVIGLVTLLGYDTYKTVTADNKARASLETISIEPLAVETVEPEMAAQGSWACFSGAVPSDTFVTVSVIFVYPGATYSPRYFTFTQRDIDEQTRFLIIPRLLAPASERAQVAVKVAYRGLQRDLGNLKVGEGG